jgi:hypothetical protein
LSKHFNMPSNNALQPTPLRVEQDQGDFGSRKRSNVVPIYRCGAAEC